MPVYIWHDDFLARGLNLCQQNIALSAHSPFSAGSVNSRFQKEIIAYGLFLESSLRSSIQELDARTENHSLSQKRLNEILNRLSAFRNFLEIFKISSLPAGLTEVEEKK
jgi:hypothetical protein